MSSSFQTVNEIEEEHSRRRVRRRGRGKKKQDLVQPKASAVEEPVSVKYDPGAANSMQWTKKYAPQSAAEVVGNAGVVAQLRQWLEEWSARNRRRRRRAAKSGRGRAAVGVRRGNSNRSNNSFIVSDDDFEDGESSTSDEDDDDFSDGSQDGSEDLPPNTALLCGPTGVGKTAAVHALARQLGFKVLEVNAGSLRGGRQVDNHHNHVTIIASFIQ